MNIAAAGTEHVKILRTGIGLQSAKKNSTITWLKILLTIIDIKVIHGFIATKGWYE